jgi:uncharacterized protein (TIGR03435 family)
MKRFAFCLISLLLPTISAAQTAPYSAFDVASIKPHEGPMYKLGMTTSGNTLTGDASNIRELMMFAYDMKNFQVAGNAPLLKDDEARWDIVAKAEGDRAPTRAEFRRMLQKLLLDRFHLESHIEKRDTRVYALVIDKNGPELKDSAPDASFMGHISRSGRNLIYTRPAATMSDIVDAIRNAMLDLPVVDQTGLTGTYNIKLTYTQNTKKNLDSGPDAGDISIFSAVREQLGLKLEAKTAPVDFVIVDKAEKPTAN